MLFRHLEVANCGPLVQVACLKAHNAAEEEVGMRPSSSSRSLQ